MGVITPFVFFIGQVEVPRVEFKGEKRNSQDDVAAALDRGHGLDDELGVPGGGDEDLAVAFGEGLGHATGRDCEGDDDVREHPI